MLDHGDDAGADRPVDVLDVDEVAAQGIDIALSLDNLSRLYRHVTLAKAIQLRAQDHVRALELIDEDVRLKPSDDPERKGP